MEVFSSIPCRRMGEFRNFRSFLNGFCTYNADKLLEKAATVIDLPIEGGFCRKPRRAARNALCGFPRRRRKNLGGFGAFRLISAVRILAKRWEEQLTHEITPKSIQLPKIPPADGLGTGGGRN